MVTTKVKLMRLVGMLVVLFGILGLVFAAQWVISALNPSAPTSKTLLCDKVLVSIPSRWRVESQCAQSKSIATLHDPLNTLKLKFELLGDEYLDNTTDKVNESYTLVRGSIILPNTLEWNTDQNSVLSKLDTSEKTMYLFQKQENLYSTVLFLNPALRLRVAITGSGSFTPYFYILYRDTIKGVIESLEQK